MSLFENSARSAQGRPAQPFPWATWRGGVLVVIVTVATFLPVLPSDFVFWDDINNLLGNPYYRGLGWTNLRWMFADVHMGHYMPVAWLTLGLDYLVWGMNPRGYHVTSVLFHAANAALFYLLSLRLLEIGFGASPGPTAKADDYWLGAAVAALVFSVHPLRVEPVAWIMDRNELVACLFTLLTLLAYLAAFRRGRAARLHSGWYWTAVALFALALLSKSIVVGLPLVLLALDVYPLRRISFDAPDRWKRLARLLAEKAPFFLLSAATSAFMFRLEAARHMTSLQTLGGAERLAVSAYSLAFYLWKTVLPWPLSPLYELPYPVASLSTRYLAAAAAVLLITAGAILARRRWPVGLTTWSAYVVLLLPVVGITHKGYQITADRYSYLACLGWAVLAGAGVRWCWHAGRSGAIPPRLARLVVTLSATAILALAALSTLQSRVWHDSETLWRHALSVDPGSSLAHYQFGSWLAWTGRLPEARAEYEVALALVRRPDVKAAALNDLGIVQAQLGELESAHASFLHALRVLPDYREACDNLWNLARMMPVASEELRRCRATAPGNGVPVRPLPGR